MQDILGKNLAAVRRAIDRAALDAGRRPDSVKILAATKTVPAEVVNLAAEAGLTLAGENRVQEFLTKVDAVKGVEWHFIGSLQTNKAAKIFGLVSLIHSLDRTALADELERLGAKHGSVTDVLIEINAGREPSKSGVYPEQVDALYAYTQNLPHVRVRGFMPVLPQGAPEKLYAQMNGMFESYKSRDPRITELSMGMSGDYEIAVRYGATIVRLGSCLFGARVYP
jgi:pyridoxal phosphate enzyme (YggS family)